MPTTRLFFSPAAAAATTRQHYALPSSIALKILEAIFVANIFLKVAAAAAAAADAVVASSSSKVQDPHVQLPLPEAIF